MPGITFKIADRPDEFEQIHRLNYKTFVVEIPQHTVAAGERLVDKFHSENTYLICLEDSRLIGMVALRHNRPFSLDSKLQDLDAYLPVAKNVCEIRLLAIEKGSRKRLVFAGLLKAILEECERRDYDLVVVSAVESSLDLYAQLGFRPFAPVVGAPGLPLLPMMLTREANESHWGGKLRGRDKVLAGPANFLPGPVETSRAVQRAFAREAISHRSPEFLELLDDTRARLCSLAKAKFVAVGCGSGTMANDMVAAQIAQFGAPGLVLSNGEFGERLADHAERFGLSYMVLRAAPGLALDWDAVEEVLRERPEIEWLWCCHCETSTGVLNDLKELERIALKHDCRLCLDCISSMGTVSLDLSGVYLASGASGKGLAAFGGLSLVFHNHDITPDSRIPRYLDLGLYALVAGVPFTASSNGLRALNEALKEHEEAGRYRRIEEASGRLRADLKALGLTVLANTEHAAPAVFTVALPQRVRSEEVGRRLERDGYLLAYASDYLIRNNWIQICLMGAVRPAAIESLPRFLKLAVKQ